MIERIADLVNADADLVRRGRHLSTTFLIEIGEQGYLIKIIEGRIVSVTPGPFVTPNYSFALRAPREEWQLFWTKVPPLSPYPRLGFPFIFPTGPGYYSLLDVLEGNYRENAPKNPWPPTA